MKDNPIDWEKLLQHLESQNDDSLQDLSAEERDMLGYVAKVKERLRSDVADEQFPVDIGWKEFRQKRNRRQWRKVLAYAAVLFVFVGAGLWMYTRTLDSSAVVDPLTTTVSEKSIKLRLADGREVSVGQERQDLQEENHRIEIAEDVIAYEIETESTGVAAQELNTLVVPFGMRTKLRLSDGTQVWVNAGTTIEYAVAFAADKREVYVQGEAFFDVKHDPNRPFLVHMEDLTVSVLGTNFGVNSFDGTIETALVSGRVKLSANGVAQLLSPGEVGTYTPKTSKFSISDDIRQCVAWKDGLLYFDDMILSDIADRLGRTYDYKFVFDDPALRFERFTMDIEQQHSISTALEYLQLSLQKLDFNIVGRTIYVSANKN